MFRRKQNQPANGENVYSELRERALGAVQAGLAPDAGNPNVRGVVIDIPSGTGWVTVIALGDGSTSMYTSVGGGIIGAGEHEIVRRANQQLLAIIQDEVLPHLEPDPGTHPAPGFIRYHVLGPDGLTGIDVPEQIFWGEREGGGNLVEATQYLIHTISTVSPG